MVKNPLFNQKKKNIITTILNIPDLQIDRPRFSFEENPTMEISLTFETTIGNTTAPGRGSFFLNLRIAFGRKFKESCSQCYSDKYQRN